MVEEGTFEENNLLLEWQIVLLERWSPFLRDKCRWQGCFYWRCFVCLKRIKTITNKQCKWTCIQGVLSSQCVLVWILKICFAYETRLKPLNNVVSQKKFYLRLYYLMATILSSASFHLMVGYKLFYVQQQGKTYLKFTRAKQGF